MGTWIYLSAAASSRVRILPLLGAKFCGMMRAPLSTRRTMWHPRWSLRAWSTSACWSDVDQDGWTDLMVTYEWGPVRYFRNQSGSLVEATEAAGLSPYLGWWNGIVGGDIDNDGDTDFVVTNFGLNTKYHANHEHPVRVYYGDFDGSGTSRIVESEFEGSKHYPIRGKSCSTNAIPVLADRFESFQAFAVAELDQIYTTQCLADALQLEVNTMASGTLVNQDGRFEFRPLPRLAQLAPSFGACLTDVNGDGNLDLYVVQNFFGPQRETGHMDGGVSLLLCGDGRGSWTPVWPSQSGLVVGGDATAVVAADLNANGQTDFLVGVNSGPARMFHQQEADAAAHRLRVALAGPPGNPTGLGATLRLVDAQGNLQWREHVATGGYLSQVPATLEFAWRDRSQLPLTLTVVWPDGRETTTELTQPPDAPATFVMRY